MESYIYLMDMHNGYFKLGETTNYKSRIQSVKQDGNSLNEVFVNKTNATYLRVFVLKDIDTVERRIFEDYIRVSFFNSQKVQMVKRDYFFTKRHANTILTMFNDYAHEFCRLHNIQYELKI